MEDILDLCFDGLSVSPLTQELVEDLLLGTPLTPQVAIEFGVDTPAHYQALQYVVRLEFACWDDVEDEEGCWYALRGTQCFILTLEQARNDSNQLNELLCRYAPAYGNQVRFHTIRDLLMKEQAKTAAGDIH